MMPTTMSRRAITTNCNSHTQNGGDHWQQSGLVATYGNSAAAGAAASAPVEMRALWRFTRSAVLSSSKRLPSHRCGRRAARLAALSACKPARCPCRPPSQCHCVEAAEAPPDTDPPGARPPAFVVVGTAGSTLAVQYFAQETGLEGVDGQRQI